jgi:hypothetical protein
MDLSIGIIGLDTSHSIEFPRRMQAPDCETDLQVAGMRAKTCLRFPTRFTDEETLDRRQAQLEAWGVIVTQDLDKALEGCDAFMIEINDPALHLEWFDKCVRAGKPVFIDKPLADSSANGREILRIARRNHIPLFSASSLRFVGALAEARRGIVELTEKSGIYGGCLRTLEASVPFVVDMHHAYTEQLVDVLAFFRGGEPSLQLEDTLEVMALLDAAERSLQSEKTESTT